MAKFNVTKILIEVVIFTSLIGTIATSVITGSINLTGAALIVTGLITLFVSIGFIVHIMREMGLDK